MHKGSARRLCAGLFLSAFMFAGALPARSTEATAPAPEVRQPIPSTSQSIDWTLTPAQIKANCAAQIKAAMARVDALIKQPAAKMTFASTVLPLENLSADLNDKLAAETLLGFVSTDRAVRDASQQCQTDAGNVGVEINARPDVYRALLAAQKSGTATSAYDKKLLSLWLTAVKRTGAALPGPQRKEVVALQQALNDLQNRFAANLGNDTTTVSITSAQASGLPDDFVASFKKDAAGSYVVPVNESTVSRFLQNASDETARKTYWMAYNNRQAAKNTPLLQQAIAVRYRIAHLMGYPSWAAYVLADRMAQTPQRVDSFLHDLDTKLLPRSRDELVVLAKLKAQDLGTPSATMNRWDTGYYDNKLRKTQYAVDQNEIRQYFPVDHTIDSVMAIYARILSLKFDRITPSTAWNPEVIQFNVSGQESAKQIGVLYLDLFPRPGKYTHFANFGVLPVRRISNGVWRMPVTSIIGNWPRPAEGKPATLSHDDVTTFFHEFGHAMAALLATAPYETLSQGFRQDFIEAPSQMLENWTWQPSILKELSSNVTSGAPLPDELIDKIIKAKHVDEAFFDTNQVMYATVDMDYHTASPKVDTTAVWDNVARTVTALPYPQGIHPQASFQHIMSGYDAGYYGYLWSLVYAQDMFTAFKSGGLESPVVGMRYRVDILQPARTYEPDAEVQRFLGRPMNPQAFYQELGITR